MMKETNFELNNKVVDILEGRDISYTIYEQDGKYYVETEFLSDLGEDVVDDIWLDLGEQDINKAFIKAYRKFAEEYDPDEHASQYIKIRGKYGVPDDVYLLIQDAKDIGQFYKTVADELEGKTVKPVNDIDEMSALYAIEHAFYQMLSVAEENLPDGENVDGYVSESRDNFNDSKEEFEKNYKALKAALTE